MINHKFISFSAVQIYDLSYIRLHPSPSTGILRTHKVARALHRYRRGHEFESRSGLQFFLHKYLACIMYRYWAGALLWVAVSAKFNLTAVTWFTGHFHESLRKFTFFSPLFFGSTNVKVKLCHTLNQKLQTGRCGVFLATRYYSISNKK